jgi:hypothetical protein
LDRRCPLAARYQKENQMELKIGSNPDRCLITVAADKADLFEVMKGLLDNGLVEICGIEDAPTLSVEAQPVLHRPRLS